MGENDIVKCHLCGAGISFGWKLKRDRDKSTLYLCEDCNDVIDGMVRALFPGHLNELAVFVQRRRAWDEEGFNKFKYFELGAEESEQDE